MALMELARFFSDAEREGFTFANGEKPTTRECYHLMAVHKDKTLAEEGVVFFTAPILISLYIKLSICIIVKETVYVRDYL